MTSGVTEREPSGQLARALIRSLTRGTAIPAGVRYLHVGHSRWLSAQNELLAELASDGHADTKFVRGAYGAGKSHFLSVVQDYARTAGWMTSHVECKIDGVQIDRFETVYRKLTMKLTANEFAHEQSSQEGANVIRVLLDRWTTALLIKVGVNLGAVRRPFDAEERAYGALTRGVLRSNLPSEFTKALAVYVRAVLADDMDTQVAIATWLNGGEYRVRVPEQYFLRPTIGGRHRSGVMLELRPIGNLPAYKLEILSRSGPL